MCLIAMSKDFFESDLPKPDLSKDDFLAWLSSNGRFSSLGGASLRMFTTLSTIFVPTKAGFTLSSIPLKCPRLWEIEEFKLLKEPTLARSRKGEHDFCLDLPLVALLDNGFAPDAVGFTLDTEDALLGAKTLMLGGALDDETGTSDVILGLDLTGGEIPRGFFELVNIVGPVLLAVEGHKKGAETLDAEEGRLEGAKTLHAAGVKVLRVGVAGLGVVFEEDNEADLTGGVEERAELLLGTKELVEGAIGLLEGTVPLALGVDDLEGFDSAAGCDSLDGVGNLEAADLLVPADDGHLLPGTKELMLVDVTGFSEVSHIEDFSSGVFSGCKVLKN